MFERLGFDYTQDIDRPCFENIVLVYDNDELYWITCSDEALNNMEEYFDDEIFVMSFSLLQKNGYKMVFATNIKYRDVLDDLKMNGLNGKVKILFDEKEYNRLRKFNILGTSFEDAIFKLRGNLSTLKVTI